MFLHLTLFWAIALASCQVTPTFSRSCSVERLQLIFGLPCLIVIYVFNKGIVSKLHKMVDILFVTMETGGLAEKSSIYFLLSKTHSIHLADKIA